MKQSRASSLTCPLPVLSRTHATAIAEQRLNYLFAHLLDPVFVDEFVQRCNGDFDDVVKQGVAKLRDPATAADLTKILQSGEWEESGANASARHKDVGGKAAFFKKIDGRWFLENRQNAEKPKK